MKCGGTGQGLLGDETDELVRFCGTPDQDTAHNIKDNLALFFDRPAIDGLRPPLVGEATLNDNLKRTICQPAAGSRPGKSPTISEDIYHPPLAQIKGLAVPALLPL